MHFDCIRRGLLDVKPHLDDWVFISLTRGLWDNISRELFLFIMGLKEDQQNKVCPFKPLFERNGFFRPGEIECMEPLWLKSQIGFFGIS